MTFQLVPRGLCFAHQWGSGEVRDMPAVLSLPMIIDIATLLCWHQGRMWLAINSSAALEWDTGDPAQVPLSLPALVNSIRGGCSDSGLALRCSLQSI